jgi:glycosyltransferase involved in cell wall biosynthesis
MRLLTITADYPPAPFYSVGRYVSELNRALAQEADMEAHVVYWGGNGEAGCRKQDGVIVHAADCALPVRPLDWVGEVVLRNVPLAEKACEVVRGRGPFDLVCLHDWYGVLAGRAVASAFGLPAVLFVHHTEVARRENRLSPAELYVAELEAWAAGWARAIVAASSSVREELHRIYRIPRGKVTVIHGRAAPEAFTINENLKDFRSILADPEQAVVLYVGSLTPPKGPDILLKAMQEVGDQHPEAKLVVVGDGLLRAELAKWAEELGVPALFTGQLQDRALAATYRCADVVVVPGRYEPTGMAAIDAMAYAKPVVVSDVGCLSEIVPGGAGLRVAAGEPHRLAEAICRILDDPEAAQAMGAFGAKHAASLTWSGAAKRLRRLLERLKVDRRMLASSG